MLIFDLKRGIEFNQGKENFDFLEEKFRRISIDLGFAWHQKIEGLPYLLEFHHLEALRLTEVVVNLDNLQNELAEIDQQNVFLQQVYTELILHLTELLLRIAKMIGTSSLAAKPFNLN
jgi:hypothetical protein